MNDTIPDTLYNFSAHIFMLIVVPDCQTKEGKLLGAHSTRRHLLPISPSIII